jgi:hypothetical protein
MLQKVHSPVGVATGVIGFGFLVAAAALPGGYGKYLTLGAWAVLEVVALLAFRSARHRAAGARGEWSVRDVHLLALGMVALAIAAMFGSAFSGSVGVAAVFVLAAAVTGWIYLPRIRARRAAGRI